MSAILRDFDFISGFPFRCKWPLFEGIDGQGHFPSRAHARAYVRMKLMNIDLRESAAIYGCDFTRTCFFYRRNGTGMQLQTNLNLILRGSLPARSLRIIGRFENLFSKWRILKSLLKETNLKSVFRVWDLERETFRKKFKKPGDANARILKLDFQTLDDTAENLALIYGSRLFVTTRAVRR